MTSTTRTIVFDDGTAENVKRLTLRDLANIADHFQVQRTAKAKELAKELGLDKYETINLLLEVKKHKLGINDILDSMLNPDDAMTVIGWSLNNSKMPKPRQDKVFEEVSAPHLVELAKMLVMDMQDTPKEEPKKEPSGPLPVNPSTSAPPQSSGETLPQPQPESKPSAQESKVADALSQIQVLGKTN